MTIILGARLDDGRNILVCDGNISTEGGGRRSSSHVKVRSVESTYKKRKALVGVAGFPADLIVYENVVQQYLNTPSPMTTDLFYKLSAAYRDVAHKHDSNGVLWLPDSMDGFPLLVCVDGNMFPRVIDECNFHAEGSGGCEARAALLGLAKRSFRYEFENTDSKMDDHTPFAEYLKQWKPSYDDAMIAYEVACQMDTYCGGVMTVLTL